MKKIGFARSMYQGISIKEQIGLLKQVGCALIYKRKESVSPTREDLVDLLAVVEPGAMVVVARLDCLGVTLKDCRWFLNQLASKKAHFKSCIDALDTTSTDYPLKWLASLDKMIQNLASERTNQGLQEARKHGRTGGRPVIHDDAVKAQAYQQHKVHKTPVRILAQEFCISCATLYRYFNQQARCSSDDNK